MAVLLNKLAENNDKMCQTLMKFDRSCRLVNVIGFLLTILH